MFEGRISFDRATIGDESPARPHYIPRVVREYHHLLNLAGSRREADPHRAARLAKRAGRELMMMDVYPASLARAGSRRPAC